MAAVTTLPMPFAVMVMVAAIHPVRILYRSAAKSQAQGSGYWVAGAHAQWWHEDRGSLGVMVGGELTGRGMARHAPETLESQVPPLKNTVRMTPMAPRTAWCANAELGKLYEVEFEVELS